MRRLLFGLLILTVASLAPASAQSVQTEDRATQLLGTWSCESIRHSLGTWTFTRNADGSLSMKNLFRTEDGLSGEFDDVYRLDSNSGQWEWTSLQPTRPGFRESGTAAPWTADKWIFEGQLTLVAPEDSVNFFPTVTRRLRMVYTTLGDLAFRREFEYRREGRWVTDSASTCKRLST